MFSCEFFEISKNILSTEHLRTTVPGNNVPFALKNVGAESAAFFPYKIFFLIWKLSLWIPDNEFKGIIRNIQTYFFLWITALSINI